MWVKHTLDNAISIPKTPVGLTIGAFDGVHLGHQALIRWMMKQAHGVGYQAVVLTFEPLPRQFFQPREHTRLSSCDERLEYLQALGVEGVIVLPFDRALTTRSAQDFVTMLTQALPLRGLWIGADFTLGHERKGNVAFLHQAGRQYGFTVHTFDEMVVWDAAPVRSSRIRRALRAGYVTEAWACLNRPYALQGPVVHGDKRGRTLGFPTANLGVPVSRLRPANGVYVTQVHLPQGLFQSVTSIGTRPTFHNRPPTVESYILDFDDDIYDVPLRLDFLHCLRPEVEFPSAEALITQMNQDVVDTQAWFTEKCSAQDGLLTDYSISYNSVKAHCACL